jgi:nucleotide-binding universal stress UspA family protein
VPIDAHHGRCGLSDRKWLLQQLSMETPMNILLAVDGSPFTKRMMAYIAAHDELLGPQHEYTLLTVVTPIPPHAARHIDASTLSEYYADQGEQVLGPLRRFVAQQGWRINASHVVGHAAEAIAAAAKAGKHDLVVMGAHGHSSLANMILGSVTTGVMARCETPVLLIR